MKELRYKWLLDFDSYYKGEESFPGDDNDYPCWINERIWVKLLSSWNFKHGSMNEYIHHGLEDFSSGDGVPMTLKVILFNRFCGKLEEFREWYLTFYKNRLKEKQLSRGKEILNKYRLAFLEYRCDWQNMLCIPQEMRYMFEISNAVDSEHSYDQPMSEGIMCKALEYAEAHGLTIDIVLDSQCIISKQLDGWTYHPEFKEIRERALAFLQRELPRYSNAQYVGLWKGKYVYQPFCEDGERFLEFPHYILLDKDTEELYIDKSTIGEGEPVRPRL